MTTGLVGYSPVSSSRLPSSRYSGGVKHTQVPKSLTFGSSHSDKAPKQPQRDSHQVTMMDRLRSFWNLLERFFMQVQAYMQSKFSGSGNTPLNPSSSPAKDASVTPAEKAEPVSSLSGLFGALKQQYANWRTQTDAQQLLSDIFFRMQTARPWEADPKRNDDMKRLTVQPKVVEALGQIALDKYQKKELSLTELRYVINYGQEHHDFSKPQQEAMYQILTSLIAQQDPEMRQNFYGMIYQWEKMGKLHFDGDTEAMEAAHLPLLQNMIKTWQDVEELQHSVHIMDRKGRLYPHIKGILEREFKEAKAKEEPWKFKADKALDILLPLYARHVKDKEVLYTKPVKLKNYDKAPLLQDIATTFADEPELAEKFQRRVNIMSSTSFFENPPAESGTISAFHKRSRQPFAAQFLQNTSVESARKYAQLVLKHTDNFYPEVIEIDVAKDRNAPESQALLDTLFNQVEPGKLFTKAHNRIFILKNLEQADRRAYSSWLNFPKNALDRQDTSISFTTKGDELGFKMINNNLFIIPLEGSIEPYLNRPRGDIINALYDRCS